MMLFVGLPEKYQNPVVIKKCLPEQAGIQIIVISANF